MPPYLGETIASVTSFLEKVNLKQFSNPFELDDILAYVDAIAINNTAAKASVDIALHDLVGKLIGRPWHQIWGYTASKAPVTTFTIGIDTEEMVKQKTRETEQFKVIKVKLGVDEVSDKMIINAVRSVTDKPLRVDANQGWKDKHYALKMIEWLAAKNVEFVEQPLPKHNLDDMAWLTEHSPLPTIADESCQRLEDIPRLKGVFDGINIKLMKCTGMREANKMISMVAQVKVGAESVDEYLPLLQGKRVGVLSNQTGVIGKEHIVDFLHRKGINIVCIFSPEHAYKEMAFGNLKGIMARSTFFADTLSAGYTVVELTSDSVLVNEKKLGETMKRRFAFSMDASRKMTEPSEPAALPQFIQPAPVSLAYQDKASVFTGVAVDKNALYFGNSLGEIKALSKKSRKVLWRVSLGYSLYATPVCANGLVIVPTADGELIALSSMYTA